MKNSTSALYIQFVFNGLALFDIEKEDFLNASGLKDIGNIGAFYPLSDVVTYWAQAEAYSQNPALGFDTGRNVGHSDLGLMVYALMNSASVQESVDTLISKSKNLCSAMVGVLSDVDERISCYTRTLDAVSAEDGRHLIELGSSMALALHNIVQETNDQPRLKCEKVCFRHSNKYALSHYEDYFGCTVLFDQAENQMFFDKNILDQKHSYYNSDLRAMLLEKIDKQLEDTRAEYDRPLIAEVQQYIKRHLGNKIPSAKEAAAYFGMSSVTLRRKLKADNTSYPKLLNSIRQSVGRRLLSDSNDSIEEISSYLGFSTIGNFTRSFRCWSGVAPSDYRAQHASSAMDEI